MPQRGSRWTNAADPSMGCHHFLLGIVVTRPGQTNSPEYSPYRRYIRAAAHGAARPTPITLGLAAGDEQPAFTRKAQAESIA